MRGAIGGLLTCTTGSIACRGTVDRAQFPVIPAQAGIHPLSKCWERGRGVRAAPPAAPRRKTYPCEPTGRGMTGRQTPPLYLVGEGAGDGPKAAPHLALSVRLWPVRGRRQLERIEPRAVEREAQPNQLTPPAAQVGDDRVYAVALERYRLRSQRLPRLVH